MDDVTAYDHCAIVWNVTIYVDDFSLQYSRFMLRQYCEPRLHLITTSAPTGSLSEAGELWAGKQKPKGVNQ
jgi:hypothetical protein